MMKGLNAYLRRTLSLALAVCMVMSMTLPAMAEGEECTHPNAHSEPGKTATCTEKGSVNYHCDCGAAWSMDTELAAHTWGEGTGTQPTCTEAGALTYTCTADGCTATKTETPEALGHNYELTSENKATCVAEGTAHYTCTRCSDVDNRVIPVNPEAHTGKADEGTVTTKPTCTETGVRTLVCDGCTESYTVVEPAAGHVLTPVEGGTPATCTEDGVQKLLCSACGVNDVQTIPALGHVLTSVENETATCTTQGERTFTCSRCSYVHTEPVAPLGHSYNEGTVTTAPTCAEFGVKTYTCATCGATKTEPIAPTGEHTYTIEGDVVTAATCEEGGTKIMKCACGAEETVSTNALKHNYVKDEERSEPGNCMSGYDLLVCSRCHDEIRVNNTGVDAHSWNDGEVLVPATCVETGLRKFTCTVEGCGATKTETIAITTHDYGGAPACKDAYCIICGGALRQASAHHKLEHSTGSCPRVNGNNEEKCSKHPDEHYHDEHIFTCSVCKYQVIEVVCGPLGSGWGTTTINGNNWSIVYNDDYKDQGSIDAKPNTVDENLVIHTIQSTQSPTCGNNGYIEYTCSNPSACTQTHRVEIPATGQHNYSVSRVESTCTVQGKITYTCTACGHSRVDTLALASHSYNAGVYVTTEKPTCTKPGFKHLERICEDCSHKEIGTDITIDALGHKKASAVEENRKEATCEEDGTFDAVTYCSVCNAELSRVPTPITKLGHKVKTGIQENFANATCTAVGGFDTVSVCETCNKELSREHTTIPALGHAAGELRNAKPASENAEGYTGDLVCPRCNETLTAGTTIPRLSTGEKVEIEPEVILEVLNEEIKLDTAAVEDLTVLAQENGNNALELLTTVNGTLNALEVELASGAITPAEYARCVEVANVAVSVALTVGAKAGSAAQAAAEQSENLPADTGIDMGAIVGDFYQRQFDAILGKNQPAVHNTSAFDGDMSGIRLVFVADENLTANGIDLSVDPEVYRNALAFIDDSVDKMTEAAATLRSCSGEAMVASVKQYIEKVAVSVFRDFDKEAADEEFLQNAYEAILLNMQQQVSASLTEAYEEASKSGKFVGTAKTELDKRYEEQMAAVADVEVFEIMVLEVMRQKYVSVLNTQLENGIITREAYDAAWETAYDVESFEPIYWAIFRAWALNEESEYPMTLQELTDATIADTTYATTHIEMRDGLSGKEIAFFTGAAVLALLLSACYILTNSLGKRKVVA